MKPSEKEFIAESEDLLEEAESLLLNIQDSPVDKVPPHLINALFRAMHTLKGMAGIYGYQGLTDMSHALESLLDDVRIGKAVFSSEVIEVLFSKVDVLKSLLDRMKGRGKKGEVDVSGHLKDIESFRESLKAGGETWDLKGLIDKKLLDVLSEYEEHRLRSNIKEGMGIYLVRTDFPLDVFDTALKKLAEDITKVGELISTMPTSKDVPEGSIGFNLIVGASITPDELGKITNFAAQTLLEAVTEKEEEETAGPAEMDASLSTKLSSSTVRVDIGKLDGILNTIEEISLARSSMKRIWNEMVESYGYTPLAIDIYRVNQNFDRRISELQRQVLEIRMVPIGQMFGRLSQVIRRYARDVGKKINLGLFGEDTEIDKYLAEEVMDPLVHIVRNAIDHGLEHADERTAAGKEETGELTLSAFQRGNNVVIEVKDDGRGIDAERIRSRAVEKGFIDPSDRVEDVDLLDLIFFAGLSTRDTVSEVSGRGVGLDIVKEKVAALGGSVELETGKGVGTTFSVTIPITLAIIKSLIVRVGSEIFAVPLSTMSETLAVSYETLQAIEGKRVHRLRGKMLPLMRLGEVLGVPDDGGERLYAVVVGAKERMMGLVVDELKEQHELVIKPLGEYFEGLRYFAGAAEIGKHEVVMVLDVESIIDETLRKKGAVNV
jgi:two-component system chemotaxis sensor kinase CheA